MTLSDNSYDFLKCLNEQFAAMEQQRDEKAKAWFRDVLSDQLVFRRANGSIMDKQKFLKSLDDQNSFTSRKAEDFSATIVGERALVTLVIHTMKADGTENCYRNIRLFSKQNQSWKLELWYNYDLTGL
jgi:hypothetical protein